VLGWLAQRGVLCLGPMAGAEQTFVLLDEWVPPGALDERGGDPAAGGRVADLARFAKRYFAGHGPATLDDLTRWGGITKADAREAIETAGDALERLEFGGVAHWVAASATEPVSASRTRRVHLLPGFDEYYIGYGDRTHLLGEFGDRYSSQVGSNGVLRPTLVIDGCVVGTWRRAIARGRVDVNVRPFRALSASERSGVEAAARRYGAFLGHDVSVAFAAE
jgi:hypothetical protein